MSYAERYFGIKEAEAREFADNLAWFGEDSYVYKNPAMMVKIINSNTAIQNPVSNEYIAKWVSKNNYNAQGIIDAGFTIGIYNSDLDRTIYFDAVKQFSDGSILYVTQKEQLAYVNIQNMNPTEYPNFGGDICTYDDYIAVAYLNSKYNNWKAEFQGIDKDGQNVFSQSWSFSHWLSLRPGFLHGIDKDILNYLKPVEPDAGDYLVLPVNNTYISDIADYASAHEDLFLMSDEAYQDYIDALNADVADVGTLSSIETYLLPRKNGTPVYWVPAIDNVEAETTFTYPRERGTIALSGNYVTDAYIQAQADISDILDNQAPVPMSTIYAPKNFMIRL